MNVSLFPAFFFLISKAPSRASIKQAMCVFMNDLQSLANIITTDKSFSKLLGYKMHLPQENICLDNTISSNSDLHTIEYLNA